MADKINKTTNPVNPDYANITNKLSVCSKVIDMMKHEGWLEIIGPRINNMINEFSGTTNKETGLKSKGLTLLSDNPFTLAKNAGKLEGMIEIYNMIMSHQVNYDAYKQRLLHIEQLNNTKPENTMFNSPYAPEEGKPND